MNKSHAVADDGLRLTGTTKSIAMAISQPMMPSNVAMVNPFENIAHSPSDPATTFSWWVSSAEAPRFGPQLHVWETKPYAVNIFPQSGHSEYHHVFSKQTARPIARSIPIWMRTRMLRMFYFQYKPNVLLYRLLKRSSTFALSLSIRWG